MKPFAIALFALAFLATAQAAAIPWDNSSFKYRQQFNVNYSLPGTAITDYTVLLNMSTLSTYNSSLQYCNFIAAWHPGNQAAPVWLPTWTWPDTCNGVWNTSFYVKIPSVDNTNGTVAVYFGHAGLDAATTYANNSGNETFLFYDNGTMTSGLAIQAVNASSGVPYPGRWNVTDDSTGGVGENVTYVNNATVGNWEINYNKTGTSASGRVFLSTQQIFTDDITMEYKWRNTGVCMGNALDGEFEVGMYWSGEYRNLGVTTDGPKRVWSYSTGPGGADGYFFGGQKALDSKFNNWSSVTVTNEWVNLTGNWNSSPMMNEFGLPNYATFRLVATNGTESRAGLNGTWHVDISKNNYKIGTLSENTTIWRPAWNMGALPYTSGRLVIDTRELCGAGQQSYSFDDIHFSKTHPNLTATMLYSLGLEGTPASGLETLAVTLEAPADDSEYALPLIDFNYSFSGNASIVTNCSLYNNYTGAMTFNKTNQTAIVPGINNFTLQTYGYRQAIQWNVNCSSPYTPEGASAASTRLVFSPAFPAGGFISSCGGLTSANTLYELTSDVYQTATCFPVSANGVVLDCKNHKVLGTGTAGQYGVSNPGYTGLIVRNCNFASWQSAVYTTASNVTVDNVTVYNTTNFGAGIQLTGGLTSTVLIKNTTINNAAGQSIGITTVSYYTPSNITVIDSHLHNSTGSNFYLYDVSNVTVINTTIKNHGGQPFVEYAGPASIIFINSTMDYLNTSGFTTDLQNLSIQWYADFLLTDNAGTPIPNGIINVSNSTSTTPFAENLLTGATGHTRRLLVTQFNGTALNHQSYTPFNASTNGSLGVAYNSSNFTINSSGTYVLRLNELVLNVEAASPANNTANATLLQPFSFYVNASYGSIKNASVYFNGSGWIPLATITTVVNGSLNWIYASFPTTGQYKWAIEVCTTVNTCNITANYTINLTGARLMIQAFNETAVPTNILFNITISNGTNTTVYPTQTGIWFNKSRSEIPLGDLQITIDNTTGLFRERVYYLYFNGTDMNLSAYLLTESLDSEIDLTLKDYAGNLKSGYYLVAQRSFVGTDTYVTIAEARTDYSGIAVMHLDASQTYRFAAYDENYDFVQAWEPVLISTLVLIATNTYSKTFIIGQQTGYIYGAGYSITASCSFDNATSTMSCTISDLDAASTGSTLSVGNLTSAGWMQVCSDTITTPDGTLSCQADGLNQSYFKYLLEVYYPDGSIYIADSGSFDYGGTVFAWGTQGFLLFAFMIIVIAAVFSWNLTVMLAAIGIASALAKLVSILNVGWESVIGLWCILVFFMYLTRKV